MQQEISLPINVDGRFFGELSTVLRGEHVESVDAQTLLAQLPINSKTKKQIRDHLDGAESELITSDELKLFDIDVIYDPVSLQLIVNIPLARMSTSVISGQGLVQRDIIQPNLRDFSFFLNLRVGYQDFRSESQVSLTNSNSTTVDIESGYTIGGWLLEGSGVYQKQSLGEDDWRHNYLRLVHDDIDRASRIIFGNLISGIDAFQYYTPLIGLGYSSNSSIATEQVGRSTSTDTLFIEATSRAEVYVNNRLIRSLYLPRGNYQIRDLPGITGINDVRVVVSNSQGEQEEFNYSFVYSQDLLAIGNHDFSYNVGVPSRTTVFVDENGEEVTPLDDHTVVSLFHRYGLSSNITIGGNFQGVEGHVMPGAGLQIASRYGTLLTQINESYIRSEESARATLLQYRFEKSKIGNLQVSFQFFDQNFSAPNTPILQRDNTRKSDLVVFASKPFGDRVVGYANYRYAKLRSDFSRSKTWEFGFASRLFKRLRLNASVSRVYSEDQWEEVAFRLDFSSQKIQPNRLFDSQFESDERRFRNNYTCRGVSGQHQLITQFSREDIQELNTSRNSGIARYENHRLESTVTYEEVQVDGGNEQVIRRVGMGGAIVMANNNWAISKPVTGSFAVIDAETDLSEKAIGVNPIYGGGFQSKISSWSPAVVSGLSPYYLQTIRLQTEDTDFEFDSELQNIRLVTSYRAGTSLVLKTRRTKIVSGKIYSDNKALEYYAGEVIQADGVSLVFFTNEYGEFLLEQLEPGEYSLLLYGLDKKDIKIVVPETEEKKISLPDIHI